FFQAEDGIRDRTVTGVQTCALPISVHVRRQDQLGADRRTGAVEAAQLDLGDVDDARELGDTLEELAELVIARLGAHRDRDLAVRSEERRVGKECTARRLWSEEKTNK